MNKESLYLWCAYPEDFRSEAITQTSTLLLSEDERARWQALRFDRDRREYLATRTLVRTALSQYRPIAPQAWRFQSNMYGKPTAEPDCGLRFNLSNTHGLVICLIAQEAEVGADVEPYDRASNIVELAPDVFSPLEIAQLEALHGQEKLDRALSLWTLKEAYIKARGVGLSLPLNSFSFLFGGKDGIRLEVDPCSYDEPDRHWRFCIIEHAGYRIALIIDGVTVPELQFWEVRPFLALPIRLPVGEVVWFPKV